MYPNNTLFFNNFAHQNSFLQFLAVRFVLLAIVSNTILKSLKSLRLEHIRLNCSIFLQQNIYNRRIVTSFVSLYFKCMKQFIFFAVEYEPYLLTINRLQRKNCIQVLPLRSALKKCKKKWLSKFLSSFCYFPQCYETLGNFCYFSVWPLIGS